jgi:hypothetical protein
MSNKIPNDKVVATVSLRGGHSRRGNPLNFRTISFIEPALLTGGLLRRSSPAYRQAGSLLAMTLNG